MPTFQIPEYFTEFTDQRPLLEVEADNLDEAFDQLFTIYPDVKAKIINPEGGVHPFIMVFVGKYHINALNGLRTKLEKDDIISLLINLAGG